jgi:transposase
MWKLYTGAQWRDLPERYGPWQTVYERLTRWRREGLIDLDLWCIDSTSVRASRSAA